MKLTPFTQVANIPFSASQDDVLATCGAPLSEHRNAVALTELDYGEVIYRFQNGGRLEEVTQRAPILKLDDIIVPFAALEGFVEQHDSEAFRAAGFLVSPLWGLAFVPSQPCWITALARYCLPQWRALQDPRGAQAGATHASNEP